MDFIPTKARYNSIYGLELRDDVSPWLSANTKHSILLLGVVTLSASADGQDLANNPLLPYEVTFVYDDEAITIQATRDAKALKLSWQAFNSELPFTKVDEWVEVPLPND